MASYHHGCIARSAISARPAWRAARSAAAAARSVVVPSLSMSESRAVTFHVGKEQDCAVAARHGGMTAHCDGGGGSRVLSRRGPATVTRLRPDSQELPLSPPATSGRGHPGRGPVVYL